MNDLTSGVEHLHPTQFFFDVESCKAVLLGNRFPYSAYARSEDIGGFGEPGLGEVSGD